MARIALTSFRKNPKLGECDPRSVFAAVLTAAQLGWEPGVNGQCYLVPYQQECQLVPGWQGLVDLVLRSGRATVWTGAVYEGDSFEYGLGDTPFVSHRPIAAETEDSQLLYVYAIGRTAATFPVVEVWPIAKILAHRDRWNKQGAKHYSFQHLEMYGRKVALLQVLKYMPKSVELLQALSLEQAATDGEQHLTVEQAVELPQLTGEEITESAPPQSATEAVKAKLKEKKMQEEIWPKKTGKDDAA